MVSDIIRRQESLVQRRFIVLQDDASTLGVHTMVCLSNDYRIKLLGWPANQKDLNHIENMWSILAAK